jgi:hypothetical protein
MKILKHLTFFSALMINSIFVLAQQPSGLCFIKIDNSRYDGTSKIELVKGKTYYFYIFGKHTNFINSIKCNDPGILLKKTGANGLTLSECETYVAFDITITSSATAVDRLLILFSGNLPVLNDKIFFALPVTIIEKPAIKRVIFTEGNISVVRPISGVLYDVKLSGTNLSYLDLIDKNGVSISNERHTDSTITCKMIFQYQQPTTFTGLAGLELPMYGSNGGDRYDKEVVIKTPTFIVLPPTTVFDVNTIDWSWGPFYGELGTYFADVTGDGKADAIAINNAGVFVRRSNGSDFQPNENWYSGLIFSNKGNFFADVTGDGKADAIAIGQTGIYVYPSTGSGFGALQRWSPVFFGEKGTYLADVTGDGKADAINVNNANIVVRPSIGNAFGDPQIWTTGAFFGERNTDFADVDGDGKSDAIAVHNYGIIIKKSVGNRFGPNETFTNYAYYGTRGTFFADATGDRKADAITINDDKITVRRSTGTTFSANEDGTNQPFYAHRVNAFADIYGIGKAAVIVVNNETVYARRPR